jgi:hypothetical protein
LTLGVRAATIVGAIIITVGRSTAMSNQGSGLRQALRKTGSLAAAIAVVLAFGATGVAAARPDSGFAPLDAQGVVHARGGARVAPAGTSPNLLWHGGQIMTSSVVRPIFWGSGWSNPGDKITGLDKFYGGVGASSYMNTNTEYTGTNGQVGTGVTFGGHLMDTSGAPRKAPRVSAVLAEVAKMITNPVANGYYPVYIDQPRGHAGYCAWHSYGSIKGVPVQFGFFFRLDGDAGCDPGDPGTIHSQGLEALANVSGHELSEAVTDPRNGGWYDSSGEENADKCAWTFSGTVKLGTDQWKIQGNWSNAASNNRSGYDGAGCIQTK